jgi:GDPmannose 4,6-dehydratase
VKKALITGITGQDGSYLAELLLGRDYEVHGVIRRSSLFNTGRIEHLYRDRHEAGGRFYLHYGDLTDGTSLQRILTEVSPQEIYNLAGQSHVRVSFDEPEYTANVNALGTLRLLEASRLAGLLATRIYQASSSEMFGSSKPPQNESTPFKPRSPYGMSKASAHWTAINYRESYGMFVCSGILHNHESPRRGETFVTRKITRAAARIKCGLQNKLYLGNLNAMRDWGYAGEYVEAMWLMLQQDRPDDFVIATGESHSVREFARAAFDELGLDWEKYVELDERYLRPAEVDHLWGDSSKAQRQLGWRPRTQFGDLVQMMVKHDLDLALREQTLRDAGFK